MRYFPLLAAFICLSTATVVQAYDFRLNFGSCHSISRVESGEVDGKIWETVASREGKGWIWGGDNIYPDFEPATPQNLAAVYARMTGFAPYADFLDLLGGDNVAGTWDDHDYGLNNAGDDYEYRNQSVQAHLDFFNVSSDDPRRARNGVFNSQYFFQKKIKVILLDNRFNRDDYEDNDGDFLGEEQWKWLETELNADMPATVQATVIVSGLQMIADEWSRNMVLENYARFGESRQRLLDTVTASSARNVVMVSGDVHYTDMSAVKCSPSGGLTKYTIPELTTSGMTHSLGGYSFPIPLIIKYWYKMNKFEYQYERMYSLEKNFGEMDFFFEDDEPRVEIRSLNTQGEVLIEASFPFSDLQESGNGIAAQCSMYTRVSQFEKGLRYMFAFVIPFVVLGLIIKVIIMLLQVTPYVSVRIYKKGLDLKRNREVPDSISEPSV